MWESVTYNKQANSSWGEASGQWSGKELLFLESSLFSLRGPLLEWPTCSIFPHKGTTVSHDPQQRQTGLLANSKLSFRERERAHSVLRRHYFTAPFPAGLSLHPKSPQLHSMWIWLSSKPVEILCVLCVLHKHWIQDNTLIKTRATNCTQFLKYTTVNLDTICENASSSREKATLKRLQENSGRYQFVCHK